MVDFTGFEAAETSDLRFLGSFLVSADSLSDARLFGAPAGADAGAAREDRRGMAKETWKTLKASPGRTAEKERKKKIGQQLGGGKRYR